MWKKIAACFAIFGAGGIVGYLVTKKLLEDKYAQLAQEEIDSVKEVLGRTSAERLARKVKDEEERRNAPINPGRILVKESGDTDYTKSKIAYNEMAKENIRKRWDSEAGAARVIEEDEDEDEDLLEDAAGYAEHDYTADRDLSDVDRTAPYIISDEEFATEFPHHDKVSLYYYRGDNTLCDENEEIISEIASTVGHDILDVMRREKIGWVRNEPLGLDYEICSVNGSYKETVAGFVRDDRRADDRSAYSPVRAQSPRERYNRKNNQQRGEEEDEE